MLNVPYVTTRGDDVLILGTVERRMSRTAALTFAALIVALADPDCEDFDWLLEQMNTKNGDDA